MEQYVAERNATRSRVSGLEAHRAFAAEGEGSLTYAGRRVVDGQALALLRSGDELLVMEVHTDQAARMDWHKPGQDVEIREGRIVSPRHARTLQPRAERAAGDTGHDHDGSLRRGPKR